MSSYNMPHGNYSNSAVIPGADSPWWSIEPEKVSMMSMPALEADNMTGVMPQQLWHQQPAGHEGGNQCALTPSSHPGEGAETTTERRPSSAGRGRKRKSSPLEGQHSDGTQKKQRTVGHHSCQTCRISKVKCEHQEGSSKCKRCTEKGLECVKTGVDKRTNRSKDDELHEAIRAQHALVLEFVALLNLLNPCMAGTDKGREAHRFFKEGLSPTRILERMQTSPSELGVKVSRVRVLRQYNKGYEKLAQRRAAIEELKGVGLRILCSLYSSCLQAYNGEPGAQLSQVLQNAERGEFVLKDSHMDETNKLRDLYGGEPRPLASTLELLPW